jgi:hypothetical protein
LGCPGLKERARRSVHRVGIAKEALVELFDVGGVDALKVVLL